MIFQPTNTPADPIREEAMAWHVRQEAAGLSPADEMALAAWLDRSPDHRAVYAKIDEFWAAAGGLGGHPLYAQTRERAAAAVARTRLTRRALAASLAAAVIGMGGTAFYVQTVPKPLATQAFQTAVGQRATVTLPDGSQVTLNTDTVVRTSADDDRRLVYLDKGQAFFKVAKDARHPFVVSAAGRTVTALGTAFDVRVDQGELKVVLVEGKVRVESAKAARGDSSTTPSVAPAPPMATDMSAGSQLVAVDDTEWRLTPTNTARETSWLKGQLVFDDEALGDIVDEMNRYSTRKITLADTRLAAHRLSGNFTPGDVHGFARMLRAGGVASLREHPSGEIEIVAVN
jgi:transmembrane sensor